MQFFPTGFFPAIGGINLLELAAVFIENNDPMHTNKILIDHEEMFADGQAGYGTSFA
jgi:hypothetical protein